MSFIIAGDIHGTKDARKLTQFFDEHVEEYTKDDYLIIVGDVLEPLYENEARKFLKDLPITVLFIDGNHENFELLNSYPIDEWNGGKVHLIENDIIHLMRGQIYEIDNLTFFTFGGAYSIDKSTRTEGLTWFPEEIPNNEEYEEGLSNLKKHNFQVDYILTHTAPFEVASAMGYGELSDDETEIRKYLQRIADNTDFTAWYFGHFHDDIEIEELFYCLFDEMVCL